MPARLCTVALTDSSGVRHTVDVCAESLFEAAGLGLAALRKNGWVEKPGRAAHLEVTVLEPVVRVVVGPGLLPPPFISGARHEREVFQVGPSLGRVQEEFVHALAQLGGQLAGPFRHLGGP